MASDKNECISTAQNKFSDVQFRQKHKPFKRLASIATVSEKNWEVCHEVKKR